MASESYGVSSFFFCISCSDFFFRQGQYIPKYAAAVHDQNRELIKAGIQPVNLQSVMIGNGVTNSELQVHTHQTQVLNLPIYRMTISYFDFQCTPASVSPIQDIEKCVRMKTAVSILCIILVRILIQNQASKMCEVNEGIVCRYFRRHWV